MKEFKVDQLSVRILENKTLVGRAAADMAAKYISSAIQNRGEAVIILATGAAQFEFLDSLATKRLDWHKVVAWGRESCAGFPWNRNHRSFHILKEARKC